ncbi:MAG: glycoside hydrolase family 3 protein, partial [Proteobacteria bacterium]|nr:glycoside hydrolase family 3 protein [Pseudomonadota bacterium]
MKFIKIFLIFLLLNSTIVLANPRISLEEKIGQMLIVGFRGLSVNNRSPIIRDIKRYNLGGVILFDYDIVLKSHRRNIKSTRQVKSLVNKLQSVAKTPLFVAIDQEGGKIRRLKKKHGFPNTLSAQVLGTKNNLNLTYKNAKIIASNLKKLGINFNFAPVVDLNINNSPVIGGLKRSFSSYPEVVTNHASTFIKAHSAYGIINAIKHFPGHGSSTTDSHYGITDVTNTWQSVELEPYKN